VSGVDCIVIGGGHNGLVCAAYLARAGRSVLVLEAAEQVGGAAGTHEFAPGYRVSSCAHVLHQMPGQLIDELALESHGLRFAATQMHTTAVSPMGASVEFGPAGLVDTTRLSPRDAEGYPRLMERMDRYARLLAGVFEQEPPRLGTNDWSDRLGLLRLGWQVRRLGRRDMRELLRIGAMNVYDLLQEHFDSPLLQGALGLEAVLGTNYGPRSPGTVLTWLYRLAAQSRAGARGMSQPIGGMGAVSEALARAATAAGATIRSSAPVARVLVEGDRACGVLLESGERVRGRTVISNADPQRTLLQLLGTEHLDTGFVRRVSHLRNRGLTAKLHLALDAPPSMPVLNATDWNGRLLIAPTLDYLERAYNHSKYGETSAAPALEITVPTTNDPSLAPAGAHVLSATVQYAPYAVRGGWDAERGSLAERVIDLLERYSPGLRGTVRAVELLAPCDIEQRFRITGGHWHHAELAFDQFLMLRPVPGAAQYTTPMPGLYLCGAGSHPGGGVMGTNGRNAARHVLARA
jgi:phytoene dehydrogenase-like protein